MSSSTKTPGFLRRWKWLLGSLAVVGMAAMSAPLHAAALAAIGPDRQVARSADPEAAVTEASRLRTAEISLSRAIEIAMRRHAGARVVDVSFDGTVTPPVFRVLTAGGGRVVEDLVDATTGGIDATRVFSEIARLDAIDRSNVRSLLRGKLELSDAVRVAEKETSGMAVGAGLLRVEGSLRFGVVVLVGDRLTQVVLEPPPAARRKPGG